MPNAAIDFGDNVDDTAFSQILEMDDEDDAEFSKSIVFGFLEQAEQTFEKMDIAMKEKDLAELASLGHFLKGSSATLGFNKVKDECEKIQNLGKRKDEKGEDDYKGDEAGIFKDIKVAITKAKEYFSEVKTLMHQYYGED